jgi:hypothetical protein
MVAASEVSKWSTDSSTSIHDGVDAEEEEAEAEDEEAADADDEAPP